MMDMGTKMGTMPEETKPDKIQYPSFSSNKDMKMKMGQKVVMKGEVVGIRDDQYGKSTSIEVHECETMGGDKSKTVQKQGSQEYME